jgi:hypothetical protein
MVFVASALMLASVILAWWLQSWVLFVVGFTMSTAAAFYFIHRVMSGTATNHGGTYDSWRLYASRVLQKRVPPWADSATIRNAETSGANERLGSEASRRLLAENVAKAEKHYQDTMIIDLVRALVFGIVQSLGICAYIFGSRKVGSRKAEGFSNNPGFFDAWPVALLAFPFLVSFSYAAIRAHRKRKFWIG